MEYHLFGSLGVVEFIRLFPISDFDLARALASLAHALSQPPLLLLAGGFVPSGPPPPPAGV